MKKYLLMLSVFLLILLLVQPVQAAPITVNLFVAPADIFADIFNFLLSILTGIINIIVQVGEAVVSALIYVVIFIVRFVPWLIETTGTILSFFANLIISVINAILMTIGDVIALIFMVVSTALNFILAVIQNIIEVINIVAMVIDIVIQLTGVAIGWFFQVVELFFGVIAGINGAPITPVPYLPRCVSAPLESQICALWYMIDWTVIADGTPGAYIIPILVLMIDLLIAAYVFRSVFKLIRWFQSLYQVV